jgi:general secretion pathway protein E
MVERLYSLPQVASLLGSSVPVIQNWVDRGWMEATQLPDQPARISESALVRFLKDRGIDLPSIVDSVTRREASAPPAEPARPAATVRPAPAEPHAPAPTVLRPEVIRPSPEQPTREQPAHEQPAARPEVAPAAREQPSPRPEVRQPANVPPAAPRTTAGGDDARETDLAGRTVLQVLTAVLEDAVRRRATAIHFEAGPDGLTLRLRVDGRLYEKMNFRARLPQGLAPLVLAKCKAMAGLDPAERRLPQHGRMSLRTVAQGMALPVAACPTDGGERLVITLRPLTAPTLEALGIAPAALAIVRRMLAAPGGLIVVTGPGCAACVRLLSAMAAAAETGGRESLAVTRGPDSGLVVARQIVAAPESGLSMAAALRAAAGQDIDTIVIDDLGDSPTLAAALEAARGGPLVLAGMVGRRPATDPAALVAAGADPLALASVLLGMVASRTVRRLCEPCKAPASAARELLDRLSLRHETDDLPTWAGRGCPSCGGTGFRGEADLVAAAAIDVNESKYTLEEAAIEAVRSGVTTVEEAARALAVTDVG